MRTHIFLWFMVFVCAVFVLLWVCQILFLQNFYDRMKTKDIIHTADSMLEIYATGDYEDAFNELALKNDMCIEIRDRYERYVFSSREVLGANCFLHGLNNQTRFIIDEYVKASESGVVYGKNVNRITQEEILIYACVIGDKDDPEGYLLLNTRLAPVSSTVNILERQLLIITVILILIGFIISIAVSKRLAKPIVQVTEDAQQLAHGRYDIAFRGGGYGGMGGWHTDRIREMDGYGIKSCENMLSAIEKSRDADPARVILAMSIPLIGADAAQRIIRALGWQGFLQRLDEGQGFDDIDGIGAERSNSILSWYADAKNREIFAHVLAELRIENVPPAAQPEGTCRNLTFVITGDVHIFRNRDAFKAYVEQQGGKVAGSVSGKTSFLINNDSTSSSSKNRKAHELNIPILTEDEFVSRFGGQQA